MINLEFTEEEKNSLYYEIFHHPHPRVQLKDYQEGGIEKLKEINFYRPKSELESQRETLKIFFDKNPPATINEVVYRRE